MNAKAIQKIESQAKISAMDDQAFSQLKIALASSPDNIPLLCVVLREYLQRTNHDTAVAFIRDAPSSVRESIEFQLAAAEAFVAAQREEEALSILSHQTGPACLARAKIYWRLGRRDEALADYRRAVAINPTLEDQDFFTVLSAQAAAIAPAAGRPKLRVVEKSIDDPGDVIQLLQPEPDKVRFRDVGGLDDLKNAIEKKIILPFKKPTLFQRFKKRVGGGILMYGPPGCGKTLLARATAGECDAAFFNIAIADVLDMYVGESERKLATLFAEARRRAPAVLFFDEVEALGGKRQGSHDSVTAKLVSTFLSEMDGFAQNNHGVLILAATNVPWSVDPAFRRPGRFDRVLFVPPPDQAARAAILTLLIQDRPTTGDLDIDYLSKHTSGFSGADLHELVERAADEAISQSLASGSEHPITAQHLKEALRQTKPTTLEWLTTARNYAKYANEGGQYDDVLAFLKKHGK